MTFLLSNAQTKLKLYDWQTNYKMHELFTKVLSRKDLSRAGDLFSVADAEIVVDLSDVVSYIYSRKCQYFNFFIWNKFLIQQIIDRRNRYDHLAIRLFEEHQWSIGRRDLCDTCAVMHTRNKNSWTILCIAGDAARGMLAIQFTTNGGQQRSTAC